MMVYAHQRVALAAAERVLERAQLQLHATRHAAGHAAVDQHDAPGPEIDMAADLEARLGQRRAHPCRIIVIARHAVNRAP